MKIKKSSVLFTIVGLVIITSCEDFLDRNIETSYNLDQVFSSYSTMNDFGVGIYSYLPKGFNRIDGAFLAGACDEAEHTWSGSSIRLFNTGGWNSYYNPDDCWATNYTGIRMACLFLDRSKEFKSIVANSMDTLTDTATYRNNIKKMGLLRFEVRFLRAFFYFELMKRYNGVPIITNVLSLNDPFGYNRNSFDECVSYIVSELDDIKDSLETDWKNLDAGSTGRATKGAALALKSRVLLYAASPLFNPSNRSVSWEKAAEAAYRVIEMKKYSLDEDYLNLFLAPRVYKSNEVIFFRYYGSNNDLEKASYPIGTAGGQSGTCPSQNLVDDYEKLMGWDASKPYDRVDPRMQMTVVVNNSHWNKRTIECWNGGKDGKSITQASRTGYYLKKFVNDELDLSAGNNVQHTWIIFRYSEILLNYAEAMNEAYGPVSDPLAYGMTALEAINAVRQRKGVGLDAVPAAVPQMELREIIRHERRIELAFEEHRFWDVRRWKIAESSLGSPIYSVDITRNIDSNKAVFFSYNHIKVEERIFDAKMYFYPIPQDEINKSKGSLLQNPGW